MFMGLGMATAAEDRSGEHFMITEPRIQKSRGNKSATELVAHLLCAGFEKSACGATTLQMKR